MEEEENEEEEEDEDIKMDDKDDKEDKNFGENKDIFFSMKDLNNFADQFKKKIMKMISMIIIQRK